MNEENTNEMFELIYKLESNAARSKVAMEIYSEQAVKLRLIFDSVMLHGPGKELDKQVSLLLEVTKALANKTFGET